MVLKSLLILQVSVFFVVSLTMTANSAELAGSEWGTDETVEQFIQFSENGKLSGFAGCNSLFGSYSTKGAEMGSDRSLKLGPLATTRKACSSPVMNAEFEFLKNLESVATYKRSSRHLELFDEEEKLLLKLKWRDFD